ncbi:MAG TPA: efflux transporter outer membrane subunit [Azoarcus sp.]|nr:efflux transporter outer membrane subunit [Azoarcus sp.]
MKAPVLSLFAALVLSGCASLAPDHERPVAPVPDEWGELTASDDAVTPADEINWQSFFTEPKLVAVIDQALDNNRDLRVAMLNVERTREQYRIQRGEVFPALDVGVGQNAQRIPAELSQNNESTVMRQYSADLGVGWELDLFGRIRNLSDAALAEFFASQENQRAAQISLVSEVATLWLTLGADRELLAIAQQTHEAQRQSHELTQGSFDLGMASALELNQVRSSLERARADVAHFSALVEQGHNALEQIVGAPVAEELLPEGLTKQVTLEQLPAGVPSVVLVRRPDILAAEHRLRAANANIGAARAAMFPRISLTSSIGTASSSLSGLFESGSRTWTFMPQVSLPIFQGGSLLAGLRTSQVDREIAVAEYEKAIQAAFREVADVLAERATLAERLDALRELVAASSESHRLSEARYHNGIDSYLGVLDAQRQLYSAQQELVNVELIETTSLVTLYKALGGGWK